MSSYFNRESEISNYLERYNDFFEARDDIQQEVDHVFQFVWACNLSKNSRAWGRSDLLTLLVEFHRILVREQREDLNPIEVGMRLEEFDSEVNRRQEGLPMKYGIELVEAYYQAAVQATNDRGNRLRRGAIIHQIISGVDPSSVVLKQ